VNINSFLIFIASAASIAALICFFFLCRNVARIREDLHALAKKDGEPINIRKLL
jgi:hypothetical protein